MILSIKWSRKSKKNCVCLCRGVLYFVIFPIHTQIVLYCEVEVCATDDLGLCEEVINFNIIRIIFSIKYLGLAIIL